MKNDAIRNSNSHGYTKKLTSLSQLSDLLAGTCDADSNAGSNDTDAITKQQHTTSYSDIPVDYVDSEATTEETAASETTSSSEPDDEIEILVADTQKLLANHKYYNDFKCSVWADLEKDKYKLVFEDSSYIEIPFNCRPIHRLGQILILREIRISAGLNKTLFIDTTTNKIVYTGAISGLRYTKSEIVFTSQTPPPYQIAINLSTGEVNPVI